MALFGFDSYVSDLEYKQDLFKGIVFYQAIILNMGEEIKLLIACIVLL